MRKGATEVNMRAAIIHLIEQAAVTLRRSRFIVTTVIN